MGRTRRHIGPTPAVSESVSVSGTPIPEVVAATFLLTAAVAAADLSAASSAALVAVL